MNHKIVLVKNIMRLSAAADALINRPTEMDGMGLIWGPTGYGKTTAACWLINRVDGYYLRARSTWSPTTMLHQLCKELLLEPRGNRDSLVDMVVRQLLETGRPLFIDEADYLLDNKRHRDEMLNVLRDIHDLSRAPIILIGMREIEVKIRRMDQLDGRITQRVVFEPTDYEDTRRLADETCDITVADDLLRTLHQQSGGSVRLLKAGLYQVELFGKARNLERVSLAEWGNEVFRIGRAPRA